MANAKPGTYQNPPHVIERLKGMLVRYKNVQAEMERRLKLSKGRLSMLFTGRALVTKEFLDVVHAKTGVSIPMEPEKWLDADTLAAQRESVSTALNTPPPPTSMQKIMTVVNATNALDESDVELLETLINFRTGGENVGIRRVMRAIQDITLLKDVIT